MRRGPARRILRMVGDAAQRVVLVLSSLARMRGAVVVAEASSGLELVLVTRECWRQLPRGRSANAAKMAVCHSIPCCMVHASARFAFIACNLFCIHVHVHCRR